MVWKVSLPQLSANIVISLSSIDRQHVLDARTLCTPSCHRKRGAKKPALHLYAVAMVCFESCPDSRHTASLYRSGWGSLWRLGVRTGGTPAVRWKQALLTICSSFRVGCDSLDVHLLELLVDSPLVLRDGVAFRLVGPSRSICRHRQRYPSPGTSPDKYQNSAQEQE